MEMDCNLKKLAYFFQLVSEHLTDYSLFFVEEITSYFPSSALRVILY